MYNAYGLNEKRVLELPFAAPIVGIHHKKYEFDVDVVVKFIYFFPTFVPGFLFLYFHVEATFQKVEVRNSISLSRYV